MRGLLRLMALLAAVMVAGLSAAEAGSVCATGSGGPASSAAPRGLWTIADVDGDRIDDLVRVATAATGSTGGALPEIVEPGCRVDAPTSAVARVRDGTLAARDLDADHDLDLVHLDAAGRPVRAWLNNGKGHFDVVTGDVGRGRLPSASYRQAPSSAPTTRLDARHAPRDAALAVVVPRRLAEAPPPHATLSAANVPLTKSAAARAAGARGPPVPSSSRSVSSR